MKFQTKTIHSVDYNDLDEAINEFLKEKGAIKTDFEIVAHHELMNDMSKEFSVGKYNWAVPSESDKSEILNGKLGWQTNKILEWICSEGKIPAGDYVVDISW